VFALAALAWIRFAGQYSRYELSSGGMSATGNSPLKVGLWSVENATFFASRLPSMVGWSGMVLMCASVPAGVAIAFRDRRDASAWLFFAWSIAAFAFQFALAFVEQRYYLYAMAGLVTGSALVCHHSLPVWVRRYAGPCLLAVTLAENLMRQVDAPMGTIGYDAIGKALAEAKGSGNILAACPEDHELIFRYRCHAPASRREVLRADRTLAVRVSPTVGVAPTILVHSPADVMDIVRRGRVRYVVTREWADPSREDGMPELDLAHKTCREDREFEPVGVFPVRIDYGRRRHATLYLWRYRGTLPDGPSEIPVRVPTAGLEIGPE
jgi:hypothetical protein